MNSRILPSYVKRQISTDSKKLSLLKGVRDVIETIFSLILLFFMTIFFIFVNQIHKDYRQLED